MGPPLALGIFVVLVLIREGAIASERRGWCLLPVTRLNWTSLVVILATAVVMRMAGYW